MKKLITAAEVELASRKGEKLLYIDGNTIITPGAKDAANELGIKITLQNELSKDISQNCANNLGIDQDLVAKIVNEVMKLMDVPGKPPQLVKEADPSGLRLIKGSTVALEKFNTGNPEHDVKVKEILNIRESPNLSSGFMSIEETAFDWHSTHDEIDHIVEGTLEYIINGKKYTATAGDVVFIPGSSRVTFSTPNKVKFFFVINKK